MNFSTEALIASAGEHLGPAAQSAWREHPSMRTATVSTRTAGESLLDVLAHQIGVALRSRALAAVVLQVAGRYVSLAPEDAAEHALLKGWVFNDAADAIAHFLWCGATCGTISFGAPSLQTVSLEAAAAGAPTVMLNLAFNTAAGEAAVALIYGETSGPANLKTSIALSGEALTLIGSAAPTNDVEIPSPTPAEQAARPVLH